MTIEREILSNLQKAGFSPDELLLVAVSGGPDSLTLAYALHALGWKIAIAHLDHQLRPESASECAFVKKAAGELGADFYHTAEDVKLAAEQGGISIEEAARSRRYGFLFKTAQNICARAVLTAHTADDQVETILMHLLRGSGTRGLSGMQMVSKSPFHKTIPLVRPLLRIWREDIERYCKERGLEPVQDASNQERTYLRNRIRHELIPLLETYNPSIKQSVVRLAEIVQDDHEFLEKQYERIFHDVIRKGPQNSLFISRQAFFGLVRGAQKAVIYRALRALLAEMGDQVDSETVSAVLAFAQRPTSTHHLALPSHLHAYANDREIILTRSAALPVEGEFPQCDEWLRFALHDPFQIEIAPGFNLYGTVEPVTRYRKPSGDLLWETYLDADRITDSEALVRAHQPGERFFPLGMDGHGIKVSDFFINQKIPVTLRKRWPLMVIDGKIAWIPGFQPAHALRVREGTNRVWHVQLREAK